MKPGPDLDKAVADKMGLVSCDGWKEQNMGSMGGPVLMSETCVHAHEACYSELEIGSMNGNIGGVPGFSNPSHYAALRLKDLPLGYSLTRFEDHYEVRAYLAPDSPVWEGETEPHACSLAYLDVGEVRITEADRWDMLWPSKAVAVGVMDHPDGTLLPPWTPQTALLLHAVRGRVHDLAQVRVSREQNKDLNVVYDPNVVYVGDETPSTSRTIQAYLWKLADLKMDVNAIDAFLQKVWDEPPPHGQPCPHRFVE